MSFGTGISAGFDGMLTWLFGFAVQAFGSRAPLFWR
jgi:hypothetical protein